MHDLMVMSFVNTIHHHPLSVVVDLRT